MEPAAAKQPKKARSPKGKPKLTEHAAKIAAFETSVLDGSFPTCQLFKAAVTRQRTDLTRDFGFKFDLDTGLKACRFLETLQHVEGPLAGQKIVLEPWQLWFISTAFGWINKVTGYPRFRRITLFLNKGQGKTLLGAGIATYFLATDRTGSRILSAATSRDQARLSFQNSRLMLLRDPELTARFGIEVEEHRIYKPKTGAMFRPMSSEANSVEGAIPRFTLIDEIHAHPTRTLYDNLRSSAAKRPDSVQLVISTAGFDQSPDAIGWEVFNYAKDILKGNVTDDSQFALIIGTDEGDAPWVESTWRKANPNYGVSIDPVEVANEANEARQIPSKRSSFFTKRLGIWSASVKQFISAEAWDACYDPTLNPSEFLGQSLSIGLDLALTRDLTARVLIATRIRDDGQREYAVWGKGYLPEESITLKGDSSLRIWVEEGHLVLTPGQVMDFGYLREDLKRDMQDYPGSEPCIDPWGAPALIQDLASDGIPVIEVRQGARTQSGPMKELEAATLSGRLRHDGNPLMRWCVLNLIATSDRNGNIAPDRENEHKKIDLGVALINGMVRASVTESAPSNGPSFLEDMDD